LLCPFSENYNFDISKSRITFSTKLSGNVYLMATTTSQSLGVELLQVFEIEAYYCHKMDQKSAQLDFNISKSRRTFSTKLPGNVYLMITTTSQSLGFKLLKKPF